MIEVKTRPDESSRSSRGIAWVAECTVDGGTFTARSRSGAPNELARQLVAAGIPDDEMRTYDQRGLEGLWYKSFHEAAKWTYTEGNRPLQRIRYEAYPDKIDARLSGGT